VLVLLLGLLGVVLATRGSNSPAGNAASPGTTAARPPSSKGGSAGTTATTAARSTGNSNNGNAKAASTSDWTPYTDPQTGYTISYPKDWSVRTNGTLTDFRDPDTGAYLRVDHVEPPRPSPEGAWYEYEPTFASENAGYQRIRIEPTTYSGYKAAIWEFTYPSGGADLHVIDLGFITPRYGFALYFQTRSADWDRLQPTFQAFKDAFKAPS
jgi:hypothetical protein